MKNQIITEIVINATPEKVWKVLTDFQAYPNWNPFVKSLTGEVKVGNTIQVALPAMNFTPKVLDFETNKKFRWLGHLFIKGLFDGEHSFELIDNGNGTTTFKHSEKFGGILVGMFKKMLETETPKNFAAMNQSLKAECEK